MNITYYLLVLCLFYHQVYPQVQPDQHVFKQQNSLVIPFSYEWTQLLQQFHNTFGNSSKDDSTCLFPTPSFDCKPFFWQDDIFDRDAYHLRPQVIYHFKCMHEWELITQEK